MPSDFATRQKNDIIRDVSSLGSLILYLLFCLFLLALRNYYLLKRMLAGLFVVYFVVILIRTFYFKERPLKISHKNYLESLDASSFPSLHAVRVTFFFATIIRYFSNIYFSIFALLAVLAVSYTRIQLKKHDWKDVSAGVLTGIAVYYFIRIIFG